MNAVIYYTKAMQVIWLRHATRNFTMGDVPLNDEGQKQAHALANQHGFSKISSIISSPKKRALMTVEPLAEKYGLNIEVVEDLDQMSRHESEKDFKSRINTLLNKIAEGHWSSKLLLCTHSDWLAMAAQIIATDALNLDYKMFQCAESLEFKIESGLWKVVESRH